MTKATLRPVGWPVSVQLPVSSKTVRSRLISTTSPATPLISTQSPTRSPFFPINTNQPKKRDDEILHRHGDSSTRQAEDGRGLLGSAEDHKQDQQDAHGLHRETNHGAKRMQTGAAPVPVSAR